MNTGGPDNEFSNNPYRYSVMGIADAEPTQSDHIENKANIRRKSKLLINMLRFNSNKNNEDNSKEIRSEGNTSSNNPQEAWAKEEVVKRHEVENLINDEKNSNKNKTTGFSKKKHSFNKKQYPAKQNVHNTDTFEVKKSPPRENIFKNNEELDNSYVDENNTSYVAKQIENIKRKIGGKNVNAGNRSYIVEKKIKNEENSFFHLDENSFDSDEPGFLKSASTYNIKPSDEISHLVTVFTNIKKPDLNTSVNVKKLTQKRSTHHNNKNISSNLFEKNDMFYNNSHDNIKLDEQEKTSNDKKECESPLFNFKALKSINNNKIDNTQQRTQKVSIGDFKKLIDMTEDIDYQRDPDYNSEGFDENENVFSSRDIKPKFNFKLEGNYDNYNKNDNNNLNFPSNQIPVEKKESLKIKEESDNDIITRNRKITFNRKYERENSEKIIKTNVPNSETIVESINENINDSTQNKLMQDSFKISSRVNDYFIKKTSKKGSMFNFDQYKIQNLQTEENDIDKNDDKNLINEIKLNERKKKKDLNRLNLKDFINNTNNFQNSNLENLQNFKIIDKNKSDQSSATSKEVTRIEKGETRRESSLVSEIKINNTSNNNLKQKRRSQSTYTKTEGNYNLECVDEIDELLKIKKDDRVSRRIDFNDKNNVLSPISPFTEPSLDNKSYLNNRYVQMTSVNKSKGTENSESYYNQYMQKKNHQNIYFNNGQNNINIFYTGNPLPNKVANRNYNPTGNNKKTTTYSGNARSQSNSHKNKENQNLNYPNNLNNPNSSNRTNRKILAPLSKTNETSDKRQIIHKDHKDKKLFTKFKNADEFTNYKLVNTESNYVSSLHSYLHTETDNVFKHNNLNNLETFPSLPTEPSTKQKIYGEIKKPLHQYVVIQKHLPYSKVNLDLARKSRIQDKSEVLYNNVADFQTLNQLIDSVKRANQGYRTHQRSHSSSQNKPVTKKNNKVNLEKWKNFKPNHIRSISEPKYDKSSKSGEVIKENVLMEILEEIKQRSNHVQKCYLEKEEKFKNKINELNGIINTSTEKESRLQAEIDMLKTKLSLYEEKKEGRLVKTHSDCENRIKPQANGLNGFENENGENSLVMNKSTKSNNQRTKITTTNYDLGKFDTEEKFSIKYKIPKLKSYAMLLKDIGLEIGTFYDDIFEFCAEDLEDDICAKCDLTENSLDNNKKSNSFGLKCQCGVEKWSYKKVFSQNTKMKKFVELLGMRIKYDNKIRLKLEEKTLKIFTNDLKTIDKLDQKVKQLEHRSSFRVRNSSVSSINKSNEILVSEILDIGS